MRLALLVVAATSLLASCTATCTEILVYGVTVRVVSSSGTGICNASVGLIDGSYTETLMALGTDPATCAYRGAGERPGTYRITVGHANFMPAILEDVKVGSSADGCHVVTEERTVTLDPK